MSVCMSVYLQVISTFVQSCQKIVFNRKKTTTKFQRKKTNKTPCEKTPFETLILSYFRIAFFFFFFFGAEISSFSVAGLV